VSHIADEFTKQAPVDSPVRAGLFTKQPIHIDQFSFDEAQEE
jgi:hypothetical protein